MCIGSWHCTRFRTIGPRHDQFWRWRWPIFKWRKGWFIVTFKLVEDGIFKPKNIAFQLWLNEAHESSFQLLTHPGCCPSVEENYALIIVFIGCKLVYLWSNFWCSNYHTPLQLAEQPHKHYELQKCAPPAAWTYSTDFGSISMALAHLFRRVSCCTHWMIEICYISNCWFHKFTWFKEFWWKNNAVCSNVYIYHKL